jgi:GNAT superfamily N-acetyltransferase
MVASLDELRRAFGILSAQFDPPTPDPERLLADLVDHYPQDRRLMLVVERDGEIVGGALGFASTLRIIALKPEFRGVGLGRRLIQSYEIGAMRLGVRTISLGAVEEARSFYHHMGYRGKHSMHKELPLPGRVLEFRLRKLEALLGDLSLGQILELDDTGKVPALF